MAKQSGLELARWIGQLEDKKGGRGIFIVDVRQKSSVADYMVIVSGTSAKHMETLIQTPCLEMKKMGMAPVAVEGKSTSWLVADFGDVMLHVFDEYTRRYYDLEGLWADAPRIDWEVPGNTVMASVSP